MVCKSSNEAAITFAFETYALLAPMIKIYTR